MMARRRAYPCLVVWVLVVILFHDNRVEAFVPLAHHRTAVVRPLDESVSQLLKPLDGTAFRSKQQKCSCVGKHHARKRPSSTSLYGVAASSIPVVATTSSATASTYMLLLALQFAFQPILTKAFAPQGIIKSTYVLAHDVVKFVCCLLLLFVTGNWATAIRGWTLSGALVAAGFPAMLYALQNYCSLTAYQNLPAITYNVLNQTKTLATAVWCYLLMGEKQSTLQMVALGILVVASLVMESILPLPSFSSKQKSISSSATSVHAAEGSNTTTTTAETRQTHLLLGVVPVLIASMTSGLAGAWIQQSLRGKVARSSLLLTVELSFFSILTVLASLAAGSRDAARIKEEGLQHKWTKTTWIPLLTQAAGGVVVGLVTKYAGAVRKGFALIVGLFLSGLLQNVLQDKKVTRQQWVGGGLAAISLRMHSAFPYYR